jgi:hypothetical protein
MAVKGHWGRGRKGSPWGEHDPFFLCFLTVGSQSLSKSLYFAPFRYILQHYCVQSSSAALLLPRAQLLPTWRWRKSSPSHPQSGSPKPVCKTTVVVSHHDEGTTCKLAPHCQASGSSWARKEGATGVCRIEGIALCPELRR